MAPRLARVRPTYSGHGEASSRSFSPRSRLGLSGPVLATLGVDAGVFHHQSLDGFAADNVSIDNLFHVGQLHPAIPDGVGINDHVRTVLALVETAGLVGPDLAF